MKIGMIGVGKLGMPCALAINQKGHDVMAYDVAKECMQKESFKHREIGPNGEPSIEPMLKESTIQFGSMQDVVDFADIIFVSVQTPHLERYEGTTRLPEERVDFNYSYLKDSIEQLSECVEKNGNDKTVIVISTVLPGTMRREIMPLMSEKIKLCYNPFFIAMGTTMQDFLNPEFILFGVYDDGAAAKAEEFYKTITNAPFFKTSIESAEAIKVFYNTYITGKITMMNAVMEVCHKIPGADCDEVTRALSLATKRIVSPSYMYGGMGDGGGCHPRDNIALSWLAKELNISYDWWENLMLAREKQTEWLADYILSFAGPLTGGMITILGKAFKPETNLTVGSPAILLRNLIAEKLGSGVNPDGISMYDPYIDDQKEKKHALLSKRVYFIATKHEEFKSYRFPSGSIVIDPWRYIPKSYPDVKYIYIGVGVNGR